MKSVAYDLHTIIVWALFSVENRDDWPSRLESMRGRPLLIPQFLQCLKRGDVVALTLPGAGSRISSSENLRLSAASVLHFLRVCGLRRMVGKVTSRIRGSKVIPAQRLGIAGPVMSILQDQRGNESKSDCMVNSSGRGGQRKIWYGRYVL